MKDNSANLLLAVSLLSLFQLVAGSPASAFIQGEKRQEISHAVSVTAVTLAVTVQDGKGRAVTGLEAEDFVVYENGKRKKINYFSQDFGAPLSLTVLLDVSGSMAVQDKLEESKEALRYLVESLLDGEDEISLLIFADGEVEVASPFSAGKERFLNMLDRTEAYGQTALNDAVAVSPEYASRGGREKRALILITDGVENDSQYSPEQAVEAARRVDVPLYAVGYKIPMSERFMEKYKHRPDLTPSRIISSLSRFSKATGGKAFFPDRPLALKNSLRLVVRELTHQYILGYTSYSDPSEEYRRVKVICLKKKYKVRAREGYYSGDKREREEPPRG